jgi:AcrR family transcriptional regulator
MARTRDPVAYEARQKQILATVEALFAERGFHQTGIKAICDAVGMSPGTLYRYFPSKSALVHAFIARDVAETQARLGDLVEAKLDRPRLLDAITDLVLFDAESAGDATAVALTMEIWSECARDAELLPLVMQAEADAIRAVAEVLGDAVERGVLAPLALEAMSRWLLAMADGALVWGPMDRATLRGLLEAALPA